MVAKPPTSLSLSVQEAYAYLAEQLPKVPLSHETVAIEQALGRVLAQQPAARVNAPPEDNSAMDGFAVRASDVLMETPLKISQRIPAGSSPRPLTKGTAARIFTGAIMPLGADTVVIQENCTFDEQTMKVVQDFKPHAHVRRTGSDIKVGEGVLKEGHRLRPQDIGLLITVGLRSCSVYRRLKVGVVATGDELVDVSETLTSGKIYESNSRVISAKVEQLGCVATRYRAKDTQSDTEAVLVQAARENDAVITIGGVSVGEEDHVQAALAQHGEVEFWKINMKPGKPFLFGRIEQADCAARSGSPRDDEQADRSAENETPRSVPVMGLPGNPVSAFVTFSLFCQPFIQALSGQDFVKPRRWRVASGFNKSRLSDREDYLRGQLTTTPNGMTVAPVGAQLSSIQGSLCAADVLIIVPPDTEVTKGQMLEVISLQELSG